MNAVRPGRPGSGAPARPATISSTSDEHAPTAVVIDRDEAIRGSVEGLLTRMGFTITGTSNDPAQAAALARDLRPDVLVLAIAGSDDVPALAAATAERVAPVVVLSDDVSPTQVAAVRDAGAHGFVPAFPSRVILLPAIELAVARFAETARLTAEIEAAAKRLETRKLIDRAKGLLMAHRGMTEPDAFRWIQRTAMDRRKGSAAVAAQVIAEFDRAPVSAAS
jgi:AmiR/NasT family two-component response regulator